MWSKLNVTEKAQMYMIKAKNLNKLTNTLHDRLKIYQEQV